MGKVLLIDDDTAFLKFLKGYVEERYPDLTFATCDDPFRCLIQITKDLDLLLVDLEMPGLDGAKVMAYAKEKGVDKNRIVVLSGRDADYLHGCFPMGTCLAVLNKTEVKQKEVLDMIFGSVQRKATRK